ncbi:MAG TPA: signal peptidase II [Candidatus Limnocylindria bacterium]|nr:signal peptidase II [Candidatus Limnocylindria bacterium]
MTEPARSRRPLELAVLLGIAGLVLVADQVSKALVVANVAVGQRVDVVGDLLQIWHAQNSGAAFSLFQNGMPLFLVVSVVALGLVAYFARTLHGRSPWFFFILGLVLGGTLGNLTDRLAHQGIVTDFISFGFGDVRFATFNIADSALVVGIALIIGTMWFLDRSSAAGDARRSSGETREADASGAAAPRSGDGPAAGAAG